MRYDLLWLLNEHRGSSTFTYNVFRWIFVGNIAWFFIVISHTAYLSSDYTFV